MRVSEGTYPQLVELHEIDFALLNQPVSIADCYFKKDGITEINEIFQEEWELLYVYIMQFPLLIRSCLRDVDKGIVNPHYLISFLSNMCAVFSGYYRRVRILVVRKVEQIDENFW